VAFSVSEVYVNSLDCIVQPYVYMHYILLYKIRIRVFYYGYNVRSNNARLMAKGIKLVH